jgi:SAM-dependent methyltransferase
MENTLAYRLWQAPFIDNKFAPILQENELLEGMSVLDVGCGPGTNTARFEKQQYLGIDFNTGYIEFARQKFGREFIVADVTNYDFGTKKFDFVLLNSLLHHIDDDGVIRLLESCARITSAVGHIHILDLVLPDDLSLQQLMARLDRGSFPRSIERWREIFSRFFEPVVFRPYDLGIFGIPMYKMLYFKGRAR